MLNSEQNVQVSDTTGDDSSAKAGYIITLRQAHTSLNSVCVNHSNDKPSVL
jgi:hypothetical protein